MTIWVLETKDRKTGEWRLSTPYEMFKHKARAEKRLLLYATWKPQYRISEYQRKEI